VLKLEVQLLLQELIYKQKVVTLRRFNTSLCYLRDSLGLASSLPAKLSEKFITRVNSFEIKADECYFLALITPIVLLNIDPRLLEIEHVQLLLIYNDYIRLLMKLELDNDDLKQIDGKIKKHHKLFFKCYKYLTPKCHYRLHFVYYIRMYGSPRIWCTIRFENFHQIVKKLLSNTNNKNNSKLICYNFMRLRSMEEAKKPCLSLQHPIDGSKYSTLYYNHLSLHINDIVAIKDLYVKIICFRIRDNRTFVEGFLMEKGQKSNILQTVILNQSTKKIIIDLKTLNSRVVCVMIENEFFVLIHQYFSIK